MNKYDSKTGVAMFLLMTLLCFATIFFYILWATSGIWVPAIVFTVILLVGFCPIYFYTNYEIDSTYLHLRMGFFKKKIPLEKIEAVYPTKNWCFSYATSYQRIAIIYSAEGKIKKTFVSPFLYAAFLNDLTDMTLDSAILTNPTNREAFIAQQNNSEQDDALKNAPKASAKKAGRPKKNATKTTEEKPAKKRAGRPKKAEQKSIKNENVTAIQKVEKVEQKTTKKKVGRPKKSEAKKPVGRPKKQKAETPKRPVGRPKKSAAKRPVGRPRKNA